MLLLQKDRPADGFHAVRFFLGRAAGNDAILINQQAVVNDTGNICLLYTSGSFETYANRYVDKSLGFALGWNYWFNWAITVAAELVAGALIMKYWFPDVPAAVWSGIFLIILFVLNYLSTRSYGESEFIFAGIKVLTVLIFLCAGAFLILGPVSYTHLDVYKRQE